MDFRVGALAAHHPRIADATAPSLTLRVAWMKAVDAVSANSHDKSAARGKVPCDRAMRLSKGGVGSVDRENYVSVHPMNF